jgi:23S rRNA (guanosine2251-2'-O)-methyltransferase
MPILIGRNAVSEALRSGRRHVERLLIAEGVREAGVRRILDLARKAGVPCEFVARRRLDDLAEARSHQGVLAMAGDIPAPSLDDLLRQIADADDVLLLLLDHIQDPQNLGAIIRTAEGAGADGVILPKRGAVGITPVVGKAAAGATEHISIVQVANIAQTILRLQEERIWAVGAVCGDADTTPYHQHDFARRTALVVGSEGAGLSRLVAERCDVRVRIPMYGRIESLNAAVASGILLYEARRQREARASGKR